MLESMVQDAIAVIPDDSDVEIMEAAKGSSADVFEKLIGKMNAEISKAILGQTLTTELGNNGSFAASKTHMDVRKGIVDADKKLVERTLNQLIQWIYTINFNEKDISLFIECAGHGVSVLASSTVYENTIQEGKTGLIYHSVEEFEEKLAKLIEDVPFRQEIAKNAYDYVAKNRLLSMHYMDRFNWYQGMLDNLPQLNKELNSGLQNCINKINNF